MLEPTLSARDLTYKEWSEKFEGSSKNRRMVPSFEDLWPLSISE